MDDRIQRIGRSRGLAALAPLLLAAMCGPARAADAGPSPGAGRREEVRWPGEGGRRIRVSLGMVLIDFARINLREESFDMAGYLDLEWTDPGLALAPGERLGQARRFRPDQVWTPSLEFVNAVEQVSAEREGDIYVDDDGRVVQRVRFSHKFQSTFDLKRFPFDRQRLVVELAPFDPYADDLTLVVDPRRVGKRVDASAPDWDVGAVVARIDPGPDGGPAGQRMLFEVSIGRRSTYYLWRVLLPMTLLVVASWVVFCFEPINLQPQISTGLAILLSLVTFTYAVDFSLPKVAYLTFIDRYTLTAFVSVLAAIFAVAAVHVVGRARGEGPARRVQAVALVVFPIGFFAAVAAMAAASFG